MSTQTKSQLPNAAIVPVEGPAASSVGAQHAVPGNHTWRDANHPPESRGESSSHAKSPRSSHAQKSGGLIRNDEGAAENVTYGLNNEQLPDRLQEALRRLVFQFSTESELSRR